MTFIVLHQPDERKIALNVDHIIAISPTVPHEFDPALASATSIHTTIGAEQQGWHEWHVVETFDEVMLLISKEPRP